MKRLLITDQHGYTLTLVHPHDNTAGNKNDNGGHDSSHVSFQSPWVLSQLLVFLENSFWKWEKWKTTKIIFCKFFSIYFSFVLILNPCFYFDPDFNTISFVLLFSFYFLSYCLIFILFQNSFVIYHGFQTLLLLMEIFSYCFFLFWLVVICLYFLFQMMKFRNFHKRFTKPF